MDSSDTTPHAGSTTPRQRTPRAYRVCDGLSEAVIYFMVIFAPWAFGTTERWSISTMNIAGCALGALLLGKWLSRWRAGYRPMRWGETKEEDGSRRKEAEAAHRGRRRDSWIARYLTLALAVLTVFVLGYCLVSAINARSTFHYHTLSFEPHDHLAWLPHSYDRDATWQAFWKYLGLALAFWATRDWLLGKTAKERRAGREEDREAGSHSALPVRLRRLLWVICLNGSVLALECILQRLSGSNKLLWIVQPTINLYSDLQFGPYAYRSNAAQYLNLVWPVCLGFWWALRRDARSSRRGSAARLGGGPQVMLLPCAILMAAAPIISTSRGGAIVAVGAMAAALVLLLVAQRQGCWLMRLGILGLFVITLAFACYLGWAKLEGRLKNIFADDLSGRTEIYHNAREIARDFPVYGTGPGTFAWVYLLYRDTANSTWAAYAHDDWLETRVTFGWAGFILVVAMLLLVLARWFGAGGIRVSRLFAMMVWLAQGGCLTHAVFDFPFQIYSILALFVLLSAVLFCVSRK